MPAPPPARGRERARSESAITRDEDLASAGGDTGVCEGERGEEGASDGKAG